MEAGKEVFRYMGFDICDWCLMDIVWLELTKWARCSVSRSRGARGRDVWLLGDGLKDGQRTVGTVRRWLECGRKRLLPGICMDDYCPVLRWNQDGRLGFCNIGGVDSAQVCCRMHGT